MEFSEKDKEFFDSIGITMTPAFLSVIVHGCGYSEALLASEGNEAKSICIEAAKQWTMDSIETLKLAREEGEI